MKEDFHAKQNKGDKPAETKIPTGLSSIENPGKPTLKLKDKEKKSNEVYVNLQEKKKNALGLHFAFPDKVSFQKVGDDYFCATPGRLKKVNQETNVLHFFYKPDSSNGCLDHSFNYHVSDIGSSPFLTIVLHNIKNIEPKKVEELSLEEFEDILINRESESTVYYGDADEETKNKKKKS